nr:hypothetical protein [Tanacetum cinerariifolium]
MRGCVFEDVKFTNMVGLEKLRLDLEEIVKFFTHGESAETKKSERKPRAQVTPTETDGVVITEVDMGDTSGLTVRATVVQTSTIFYDTHATLGLSHFLCYQSILARVLLVEKVVRNAKAEEAQHDREKEHILSREQIDSLAKFKWTALNCKTIPWFSHDRLRNLQSWIVMPSHKATTSIEENIQAPQEVEMANEPHTSKVEIENIKEDVELPSLNLAATIVKDIIITPLKESRIDHSRRLALITKFVASPRSKRKSVKLPSFRKHVDDLDLMLISDSKVDEPTETDEATGSEEIKVVDNSWITCGIREYNLLLTRKVNSGYGHMNLEAKYDKKRLRRKEKELYHVVSCG